MAERGAKKGGSLRKWYAQQRSLDPLYVHPNAALLYLTAECQELVKLPVNVYQWDEKSISEFLQKPFMSDALTRKVREILSVSILR